MPNEENLKRLSPSEARKFGRMGGKASGESRRKKADFRRTLNLLLTAEIDSPEYTPMLEALGLDSTLESAVNAAMIRKAMNGDVKAYEAIAKYAGQSAETEQDQKTKNLEIQKLREELEKQRMENEKLRSAMSENDEIDDDGFLEALKGTAEEDWTDEED